MTHCPIWLAQICAVVFQTKDHPHTVQQCVDTADPI